jgi:hypothetical protein
MHKVRGRPPPDGRPGIQPFIRPSRSGRADSAQPPLTAPTAVMEVLLLPERAPERPWSSSHDHLLEIYGEVAVITTEMTSAFSIFMIMGQWHLA